MSKPLHGVYSIALMLVFGWLCCACCGCGAGAYEKRLNERTKELRQAVTSNLNMVDLAGSKISLGVPKELAELPAGGDDRELRPPVAIFDDANLPAWKGTYAASVTDADGGKQRYYCYVGVAPGTTNIAALTPVIQQKFKEMYPEDAGAWSDANCPTPEGINAVCKRYRITAPQEFIYLDKNGKGGPRPMPGTVEIYLREVAGSLVMVVWRLPTTLEEIAGLKTIGPQVAGSIGAKED